MRGGHLGGLAGRQVLGEELPEVGGVDVGVGVCGGGAGEGTGGDVLQQVGGPAAEGGGLGDGFALVGGIGGDVDQGLDRGVTGGGAGDDGAAVGVADEDDGPGMVARNDLRYAVSPVRECSGFAGAWTV